MCFKNERRISMGEKIQAAIIHGRQAASSATYRRLKGGIGKARTILGVSALALAVLLSACSPVSSTLTPPPAATSAPTQTATPTSLDPCVLIDSQEASTFTGASYGAGEEGTIPGGGKLCTYGSETTNMFTVEVAQAPDVDTAQNYKAQFLADLEANAQKLAIHGLNTTELPTFADGATLAQLSLNVNGIAISGSAIGFLKGTVFIGFSDVVRGGAAPDSTAVQAEAEIVLGRLP
jgi:hypothetical protein